MDLNQWILVVAIIFGVILLVLVLALAGMRSLFYNCAPNEVLIFYGWARRRIDAQIASTRSAGSEGPSIPGIANGRKDGTDGTQFDTSRPCARRSSTFAASSAGSFISHRPIASKPAFA